MAKHLKLTQEDELKRNEIIQKRVLDLIDELSNKSLINRPDCYYDVKMDDKEDNFSNDKTFFLINSIVTAIDETICIVDLKKIS